MIKTDINGVEYELATSLRVAYQVQGQHNHKAYSEVFAKMGDMTIEEQIGILFCAFQVANPDIKMSKADFLNYYLDNYNLKYVLNQAKQVIQGIMGLSDEEVTQAEQKATTEAGN